MCVSSSISLITILVVIYSWLILIGMPSSIPTRYIMDISTNCKDILVTYISLRSSLLYIGRGTELTLAPKSHRTLLKIVVPITYEIKKYSGSFNIGSNQFWITMIPSSISTSFSLSPSLHLLDIISFTNLAYEGILDRAFVNGILMCGFLNNFTNLLIFFLEHFHSEYLQKQNWGFVGQMSDIRFDSVSFSTLVVS